MKYDVIAIGSIVYDLFLEGVPFIKKQGDEFATHEGICVSMGSKIDVPRSHHRTGGSALNTAITFSRQNLNTALVGKAGNDEIGLLLQARLHEEGISDEMFTKDNTRSTATSILMHTDEGERTIFAYRGASADLHLSQEQLDHILESTSWIYMTHIPKESESVFAYIMQNATRFNVKIALNPGSTQLKQGKELVPLLSAVSVIFVNKEEASQLTGVDYDDEAGIFRTFDEWIDGIAVMTKGREGVTVSDGQHIWSGDVLPDPPQGFIDRTGAGDAFGSGFTTALMKDQSIEDAIQLGSANATGVITDWGANRGLLRRNDSPDKYGLVNIQKEVL